MAKVCFHSVLWINYWMHRGNEDSQLAHRRVNSIGKSMTPRSGVVYQPRVTYFVMEKQLQLCSYELNGAITHLRLFKGRQCGIKVQTMFFFFFTSCCWNRWKPDGEGNRAWKQFYWSDCTSCSTNRTFWSRTTSGLPVKTDGEVHRKDFLSLEKVSGWSYRSELVPTQKVDRTGSDSSHWISGSNIYVEM